MTDLDISPQAMRAVAHLCRSYGGEFRLRHRPVPGLIGISVPYETWMAEIVMLDGPGPAPIGRGETPEIAIRAMLRMAGG